MITSRQYNCSDSHISFSCYNQPSSYSSPRWELLNAPVSGTNDVDRREKALLDSMSYQYRTFDSAHGEGRVKEAAFLLVKQHQEPQISQVELDRYAPSPTPSYSSSSSSGSVSGDKNKNQRSVLGRKGDPRMHLAVAARLARPTMPLLDALIEGGFTFIGLGEPGASDRTVKDDEGTLLYQRKNQLNRRIRLAKTKQADKKQRKGGKKATSNKTVKSENSSAIGRNDDASISRTVQLCRDEGPITEADEDFRPPHLSALKGRRTSTASLDDFFMALPDELDGDLADEKFIAELTQDEVFPGSTTPHAPATIRNASGGKRQALSSFTYMFEK